MHRFRCKKRDDFRLVAGSAGARHVSLLRWLDHKWASEREYAGWVSEGEIVRGVLGTQTASASPTEEGQDACPHIYTCYEKSLLS